MNKTVKTYIESRLKNHSAKWWKERFTTVEGIIYEMVDSFGDWLEEAFEVLLDRISEKLAVFFMRYADEGGNFTKEELDKLLTKAERKKLLTEFTALFLLIDDESWPYDNDITTELRLEDGTPLTRLWCIRLQLKSQIHRTLQYVQVEAEKLFKESYAEMFLLTAWEVFDGLKVACPFEQATNEQIEEALRRTWRPDGYSVDTELWNTKRWAAFDADRELTHALTEGKSFLEVEDILQKTLNVSKNNCKRIVRTHTTYLNTLAQKESFSELGVEQCVYTAVLDERTSEICQSLDGTVLNIEDAVPWENAPPMHYNCRSTLVPLIDGETYPDYLDSQDSFILEDMSYNDWIDSLE